MLPPCPSRPFLLVPTTPRFIMHSQSDDRTLFTCEHTHSPTHSTGKKIWRILRRWTPNALSRSSQHTIPTPYPQCTKDHHRETGMQDSINRHDRQATANPLRAARCAPPARGINQTLMAITLAEDSTSISALKTAQYLNSQLADFRTPDKILAPTRAQQERDLRQTLEDIERASNFWWNFHQRHRGLIHFPLEKPWSSYAGPYSCRLCRECRDALTDSRLRQRTALRDHFVFDPFNPALTDEFDPEITLDNIVEPSEVSLPLSPIESRQNVRFHPRSTEREQEQEARPAAQLWAPRLRKPPGRPSPPHLWRPPPPTEPTNRKIAIPNYPDFIPRGRTAHRDNESLSEADLSPPISPHAPLWRPRPQEEPAGLDPTRTDGSLILGRMRTFLSLPDSTTPADFIAMSMLDKSIESKFFSPFISNSTQQTTIPPHVRVTRPRDPRIPRSREPLFICSKSEAIQARQEFYSMALALSWPEPPSPPAREEVRGDQGFWEADESVWDDIEDAPNTTIRVISTPLTRQEVLCYQLSRLRQHRVPILRRSPLRNETVVEDDVSDEEEEWI